MAFTQLAFYGKGGGGTHRQAACGRNQYRLVIVVEPQPAHYAVRIWHEAPIVSRRLIADLTNRDNQEAVIAQAACTLAVNAFIPLHELFVRLLGAAIALVVAVDFQIVIRRATETQIVFLSKR